MTGAEQERHVERIMREAVECTGATYPPRAYVQAQVDRAVRLALADQARRDHEHAHAILDELRTVEFGGLSDKAWNDALAAVRKRLNACA